VRTIRLTRLGPVLATLGLTLSVAAGSVSAGGPPSVGFYVDGDLYRTIGTPTDFTGTGAPAGSYEAIYALGSGLLNVAEAGPGQPGFKGGRWMVLPVTWAEGIEPVQLTSNEQVAEYAANGWITIGTTPVKMFECPVIKVAASA
jgi:hypothetical protein